VFTRNNTSYIQRADCTHNVSDYQNKKIVEEFRSLRENIETRHLKVTPALSAINRNFATGY
jgi:hypothetical protein